jgi:hypothetical protein
LGEEWKSSEKFTAAMRPVRMTSTAARRAFWRVHKRQRENRVPEEKQRSLARALARQLVGLDPVADFTPDAARHLAPRGENDALQVGASVEELRRDLGNIERAFWRLAAFIAWTA